MKKMKLFILPIALMLLAGVFSPAKAVEYYLPSPGILPDHPFYWVKMIRDRVGLVVTWNKKAKAEKLLLYADKRLGAGWELVEGNKMELGVSTITKAEKYLERARTMGEHLDEERLKKAVAKHKEVLLLLADKIDEEHKTVLQEMLVKF